MDPNYRPNLLYFESWMKGHAIEALKDDTVDEMRPQRAVDAFKHTAEYDKAISTWIGSKL